MAAQSAAPAHADHAHPGVGLYVRIAVVLFVLTALEVWSYDLAHGTSSLRSVIEPIFIPLLIGLSAVKFALVGMFYMHLKTDQPMLSWIFLFSLLIASVVILGLMALFWYLFHHGI